MAWGGSRLYVQRRDRMLAAAASRAIDARDYSSAWVWLQRLYRDHPDNIDTNRLIARFDATQRSPDELAWRVRVIQIGPATLDDYLDWAAAALRLGQTTVALEALNHIPGSFLKSAGYYELLAGACVAAREIDAADDYFATAARIEPSNPIHLANLAALRLTSATDDTRQAARATLEHLVTVHRVALPAIRALLDDALRQHDPARIVRFRSALRAQAGRTLDDELACISPAPTTSEARADLIALWKGVETDPSRALQVAEWMMRRGDSAEALDWLRKLPAAAQSFTGVQMGEADGLTAMRDWAGLRAFLEGTTWRNCDFLRIALLVRCARETGASTPAWAGAVAACHGNGSDLLLLAQTAAGWSWHPEAEALYWQVTELGFPTRGPALKALWDFYAPAGDTGALLRVAREQYGDAPADPTVRNNFAFLSLLTGIGSAEASRIAEENFRAQPENLHVAATYAYALYLDGRYPDGLRILSRFGENRMRAAGTTLYLALLQQAAGDEAGATRSAATIDTAKLLPEERILLQKIGSKPQATPTPRASV